MIVEAVKFQLLAGVIGDAFAEWAAIPYSGHPVPHNLTRDNFVVVRTKSDELAIEQGCYWDADRAEYATNFIEKFVRHVEGRLKGQLFKLLDWQKDIIWRLIGWVRADGFRRFRTIYIEQPKKGGKTILIMALALFLGIADGEPSPQIYTGAVDAGQSEVLFKMMTDTIEMDPALSAWTKIKWSYNRIEFGPGGFLKSMSAAAPNKDGVNAHAVIFDELHRFKSSDLWDVMQGSMIARDQPMIVSITTAGDSYESLCRKQHEYTLAVNSGETIDTTFDGVIYAAPRGADPMARETWYRANPSLGHSINETDFEGLLKKAVSEGPRARARFFRLHLGIWSEGSSEYIPSAIWDTCIDETLTLDSVEPGTPCYMGIDLARVNDLACVAMVFGTSETGLKCFVHTWCPEEIAQEREKLNRWKYLEWAEKKLITLTPGSAVDFRFIQDHIIEMNARFKPKLIYVDSYQATQVHIELADRGVKTTALAQTFRGLSNPTKEFQRLVLSKKVKAHANPLLSWSMGCVGLIEDASENVRIRRKTVRGKIDPVAALIDAVAAMIDDTCVKAKPKPKFMWVGGKSKPKDEGE